MSEENMKDFTINWIVTGLLLFSLIAFTTFFMLNNNPDYGLNDGTDNIFSAASGNISSRLLEVSNDADIVSNITANTNPEVSDLGSRDSVASAYSMKGTGTGYWEGSKTLLAWIFSGAIGEMLIVIFGGIIGFLAFYYIVKFIRNGI